MKAALPWIGVVAAVFALLVNEVPPEPGSGDETTVLNFASQAPKGLQEVDPDEIGVDCTDAPRCPDDYLGLVERMSKDGQSGADWLMTDLASRDLLYAELDNVPAGGIQQIRMVFEDPHVGVFEALLHVPSGQPPWSGTIAVPGRNRTAAEHPDRLALAEAGAMVIVLQPRGSDGGPTEARLGVQLAPVGLTLADLRAYEIALLRRYLAGRGDVTAATITVLPAEAVADPG
ncbi:MAG: hypothetical protein GY898_10980 [Proteobacteria bacterium]|nr:hypothetical protein [Pseudomonadota bacterium]